MFFFLLWFAKVRDTAARKTNRGRSRKRWGRGRGENALRKTASFEPLEIFETASEKWTQQTAFLIGRHNVNCNPLISECQIPGVYKLQRSTVACKAAYLICVCSKKYPSSVFDTSSRSSTVLKLQRIIFKSKRAVSEKKNISGKREKLSCTFFSEIN